MLDLFAAHAYAVCVSPLDAPRVEIADTNDALHDARFATLPHLHNHQPRGAAGRGMRIAAQWVRTTQGDEDPIPGRRDVHEIGRGIITVGPVRSMVLTRRPDATEKTSTVLLWRSPTQR